jgi:hypothetical protein
MLGDLACVFWSNIGQRVCHRYNCELGVVYGCASFEFVLQILT